MHAQAPFRGALQPCTREGVVRARSFDDPVVVAAQQGASMGFLRIIVAAVLS
ncbi:hypothetical protein [Zoogloea dura]|uniref:Uncharacterized protein n=1 Tax=Zoogloea dura TaxID=2728840 RepID=A0A848G0F7_9RHOO|nr:hypothetical protein [Zoogloea dura]NML24520.1 hypothetical protein [Zoogloea dura]